MHLVAARDIDVVKSGTVLLVEDNPDDVFFIKWAFKKARLDLTLTVVSDGRDAVDYLQGNPPYGDRVAYPLPTLIILDLRLPGMHGLEVLRWIRSHPAFQRLPITILTGSVIREELNRAYDLGANSFLLKPLSLVDLKNTLQQLAAFWFHAAQLPQIESPCC